MYMIGNRDIYSYVAHFKRIRKKLSWLMRFVDEGMWDKRDEVIVVIANGTFPHIISKFDVF